LTESETVPIIQSILKALVHMHKKRIIHRDLKPENILFQATQNSEDLKVADFGLSYDLNHLNNDIPRCGTPGYVAPEVLGYHLIQKISEKSDVFSVGVILYRLWTG